MTSPPGLKRDCDVVIDQHPDERLPPGRGGIEGREPGRHLGQAVEADHRDAGVEQVLDLVETGIHHLAARQPVGQVPAHAESMVPGPVDDDHGELRRAGNR
jgi:hypothetical protein